MSFSGKFTPTQLNLIGDLNNNRGFSINSTARGNQGAWTPNNCEHGAIVNGTILKSLTLSVRKIFTAIRDNVHHPEIPEVLDSVDDMGATVTGSPAIPAWESKTNITQDTYRKLLELGKNSIPALANTKPTTFKPTYAGYGSWKNGKVIARSYPPRKYTSTGTTSYSYMGNNYSYIIGWPGTSAWQTAITGTNVTDSFKATRLSAPNTIGVGTTKVLSDYDEYFSNGFISTVARQAYYEMWCGVDNPTNTILASLTAGSSFKSQKNEVVGSFVNSRSFDSGVFSNINDTTSSNISGVNQAFAAWGEDLVNSGRVIDLAHIDKFGLPSVLLRTLKKNGSLTKPVSFMLMSKGLTQNELDKILSGASGTPEQEQKIYNAFTVITGNDLSSKSTGVLYGLNCKTANLESLADLLDPKKLFPNSYSSLTLPEFNLDRTVSTSSKIYKFIYSSGGVNSSIQDWGTEYLDGILPHDLVLSCGAFSMTMTQIKNISSMNIEKFSQVVASLELTGKNLNKTNTTTGTPADGAVIDSMLAEHAMGSGANGTFRQCDFQGAAAGYPYNIYYTQVLKFISQLNTTKLKTIYDDIDKLVIKINSTRTQSELTPFPGTTQFPGTLKDDAELNALITKAETELASIATANSTIVSQLNYYWSKIGEQLMIEQRAIPMAMNDPQSLSEQYNSLDGTNFVKKLDTYAKDSGDGQLGPILELISDAYSVNNGLVTPAPVTPSTTPTASSSATAAATTGATTFQATTTIGGADNGVTAITTQNGNTTLEFGAVGYTPFSPGQIVTITQTMPVVNETRTVLSVTATSVTFTGTTAATVSNNPVITATSTKSSKSADTYDSSTLGGQSLIAAQRESRNAHRLNLVGGELSNNVDKYLDSCGASATPTIVNGVITSIKVDVGSTGYTNSSLPNIVIYPVNVPEQAVVTPVLAADGSIKEIKVVSGGRGYPSGATSIVIDVPPQCQQQNDPPTTYADNKYSQLVPPALAPTPTATSTVEEAIADVTTCNCDCWT